MNDTQAILRVLEVILANQLTHSEMLKQIMQDLAPDPDEPSPVAEALQLVFAKLEMMSEQLGMLLETGAQ